jgi:hypothetical protein
VDPDAESVEVWDFESAASSPERCTDRLPVRLGGRSFGELDLRRVFAREL